MSDFRFSVFTATYNRGHCLRQLYSDLLNQTFKDFEWVIVSDGSTDETADIVHSMIDEKKIEIVFIDKPNGGKHTAWREATKVFRADYVIGADDDDRMPASTLEVFNDAWKLLENQPLYPHIWEIRGRCVYANGEIVGPSFPEPYYDAYWNDVVYREHKACEMRSCRKVSVLRNEAAVPEVFPYCDYVSNFPELIRWSRASRKYKSRIIPNVVRIYNYGIESESLSSSKTKSIKLLYNGLCGSIFLLNEQRDYLLTFRNIAMYLRNIKHLSEQSLKLKVNPSQYLNHKSDVFFYRLVKVVWPLIKRNR